MSLNKFCTILKAKRRSESEGTAKKHGKNKRQKSKRAASPSPSSLSMRTDRSMDPPTNFKDGETFSSRIKRKRETSPVTSYISLKSDNSMSVSKGNPSNLRVRAGSPTPTCLSLNTDWSMDPPTNFKDVETLQLDSRLLTEQLLRCPVCKSMLKDPVSIPCGHNYCNSCINAVWENCAGEYICPRCGKASETRPVLNINATLAEVVKNFQLAGFSPALPPQSYAGPEDVACDFCPERKFKSVKYCLTCDVSLCETHVRQHYTIPGLQKHTLSDVTGDIKTRPFQNSDHSFNNTDETQDIVKHLEVLFTPGPTIPTTHKPESTTDVEPEPTVRKIMELGIIPEPESEDKSAQEMAVTGKLQTRLKKSAKTFRPKTKEKKDKVRSIALICSTLQQEVSGLKEKLSKLETMNTRKSIYEDGEEYDYEINSGEEDDDDDDDDDDDEEEDYGEEYDYEEINSGEEEEDDDEEEDYGEEEEKDDGDDTGDYSEKDFDEESDKEEEGNEDGFDEDGFKDMYDGEDDFCVENEDEDDDDKDNSEEDYDDDMDY